jgi:hypothetical protein
LRSNITFQTNDIKILLRYLRFKYSYEEASVKLAARIGSRIPIVSSACLISSCSSHPRSSISSKVAALITTAGIDANPTEKAEDEVEGRGTSSSSRSQSQSVRGGKLSRSLLRSQAYRQDRWHAPQMGRLASLYIFFSNDYQGEG